MSALIDGGDLGAIATYRNRFSYLSGTPDARSLEHRSSIPNAGG